MQNCPILLMKSYREKKYVYGKNCRHITMYEEYAFMDEKYTFPTSSEGSVELCVVNQNMCVNFICVKPLCVASDFPVASAMKCTITKSFLNGKMIINGCTFRSCGKTEVKKLLMN